jgi:hypothetical protein
MIGVCCRLPRTALGPLWPTMMIRVSRAVPTVLLPRAILPPPGAVTRAGQSGWLGNRVTRRLVIIMASGTSRPVRRAQIVSPAVVTWLVVWAARTPTRARSRTKAATVTSADSAARRSGRPAWVPGPSPRQVEETEDEGIERVHHQEGQHTPAERVLQTDQHWLLAEAGEQRAADAADALVGRSGRYSRPSRNSHAHAVRATAEGRSQNATSAAG